LELRKIDMRNAIFFIFFLLAFGLVGYAQTPGTVSAPTFIVDVEGGKTLTLNAADFAKFPQKEVRGKDHDGKDTRYSGVDLRDILVSAGAIFGKDFRGPQLRNYVVIEAADGYRAVIAAAELDPGFSDRTFVLAYAENNKPLSAKNGPWQMIVPDDKKHGRWVRQVTAIRLRSAK